VNLRHVGLWLDMPDRSPKRVSRAQMVTTRCSRFIEKLLICRSVRVPYGPKIRLSRHFVGFEPREVKHKTETATRSWMSNVRDHLVVTRTIAKVTRTASRAAH
jgi:hypothetical protein